MLKNLKPIEAFALYKLENLSSDSIVSLVNDWLREKIYTESLGELCGISNPIMSDVGPLFEQAMKELGLEEPGKLEAANIIVLKTLEQIVRKNIDPVEGASFLYWEVYDKLTEEYPDKKYVGDNLGLEHIFCWLREIWDCRDGSMILYHTDLPRDEAEMKFTEHLIEEVEKLLKRKFPGVM